MQSLRMWAQDQIHYSLLYFVWYPANSSRFISLSLKMLEVQRGSNYDKSMWCGFQNFDSWIAVWAMKSRDRTPKNRQDWCIWKDMAVWAPLLNVCSQHIQLLGETLRLCLPGPLPIDVFFLRFSHAVFGCGRRARCQENGLSEYTGSEGVRNWEPTPGRREIFGW